MQKILLLSDIPPCQDGSAGIALENLCRFIPRESLACFTVSSSPDVMPSPLMSSIRFAKRQPPVANTPRAVHPIYGSLASFVYKTRRSFPGVQSLVPEIVDFGRNFGADAIWCLLESDPVIRLAVPVARRLNVPLLTQVFDPPHWWSEVHKFDRVSAFRILRSFRKALQMSVRCAVTSDNMARDYRREYGVDPIVLFPSVAQSMARPAATGLTSDRELTLGMAGQLYSSDEWDAMLAALDRVGWVVRGRQVRVLYLGTAAVASAAPRRIERLGWRPHAEAVRLLSECDVLYCPYWFSQVRRRECEQSFPSKLTTYLAAGRPVLCHGPLYASPAGFLRRHDAGLCCSSLEPGPILAALESLIDDTARYGELARNGRAAFDAELSTESQLGKFAEFLGTTQLTQTRMSA